MITTQPWLRPLGTRTMSPGFRIDRVCSDSARRSVRRSRAACASTAAISARSRAYAGKSPRSHTASAQPASIAVPFRASERATPTTDRSDWNWANDCSSRVRARSRPTLETRFTAML